MNGGDLILTLIALQTREIVGLDSVFASYFPFLDFILFLKKIIPPEILKR